MALTFNGHGDITVTNGLNIAWELEAAPWRGAGRATKAWTEGSWRTTAYQATVWLMGPIGKVTQG